MLDMLYTYLTGTGLHPDAAEIIVYTSAGIITILLAIIANFIAKRIIVAGLTRIIARSETTLDNILLERGVFNRLSHLAPALVISYMAPIVGSGSDTVISVITRCVHLYVIVVVVMVVFALLDAVLDIYNRFEVSREIPIKGFLQVIKIVGVCIMLIVSISIIFNRPLSLLLGGLGALTAVLLLIFKDSILGFVAGIMLISNRMVAHGDWIEMPKYGADGDVIDVSLTTVKVQNWDKTISTIPTYALISDSFKNWRGMEESGGRRIKRAIHIDMTSIRFLDERLIERLAGIRLIRDYLDMKKKDIDGYNATEAVDDTSMVNGRRLTNIGTFRAYVVAYLKKHPEIRQDMTFLVRQLAPTEYGLPIEIYVFSADQRWSNYEAIQADIFDHILAAVPEFDLRVFQNPTGNDFRTIGDMAVKR